MFGFGSRSEKRSSELVENVYHFSESPMLDCNMYILKSEPSGSEELTLIDTGNGRSLKATIEAIDKLGMNISNLKNIILTHEHLDHVIGLYAIKEHLGNNFNDVKIYAQKYTARIIKEGDEEKIAPRMLGISAANFGVTIDPIDVIEIDNQVGISLHGFTLKTFDTPGHSVGSVTLYEEDLKILFPGDVVFPQGSFGRYDFPGASLKELQNSIKKINELDVSILCSGHMPPVVGNANKSIEFSLKNIMGLYF